MNEMRKQQFTEAHTWVRAELDRCVNFWLKNGMDPEFGGVYTCLDRTGKIYSTDKSVWMQGRCGWIFAHLCTVYGAKQEWLDASRSCLDFMERHCFNHAAGDRLVRARQMADLYWDLNHGMEDPVGMEPKTIPETRSGRAFGIPMIYLNVALILMRCDPERMDVYAARATQCVEEIFKYFVKFDLGCTLENVAPDGTPRFDFTDGRIVNPGHDIEGVWFLLEYAKQFGKPELIEKAQTIFDNAIHAGWDEEYGGLLYFVDAKGLPPESYEHDMKLWWPHNEILISSMMLYRDTGNERDLDWFFKTLDYCQKHFSDPDYGEWYGYLRRDGLPTMPSTKGSTFKGPFHLPRCLMQLDRMMTEIEARA